MQKMIILYAEPAPAESCEGRDYYLPHHGVVHPTKGKMRVVFDCAAKSGGAWLNDLVIHGPNLGQTRSCIIEFHLFSRATGAS